MGPLTQHASTLAEDTETRVPKQANNGDKVPGSATVIGVWR